MASSVKQSNEDQPLMELGGYTFSKIVVDQMTDADGTKHEVMFVAAHKDGKSTPTQEGTFVLGDLVPNT